GFLVADLLRDRGIGGFPRAELFSQETAWPGVTRLSRIRSRARKASASSGFGRQNAPAPPLPAQRAHVEPCVGLCPWRAPGLTLTTLRRPREVRPATPGGRRSAAS